MSILTIGQSAPPFSLSGIDGKTYTLNQNGVRLTLAVFFRTTCPTCKMTWPYLEKLYQALRGAGLAVWGISQNGRDDSADFASGTKNTFPILIDADLRASRVFDPEFVPTLFLIDRAGKILDSVVAFDKGKLNHLAQIVAAHLGVPAPMLASPEDPNPPFRPG